jgi:hypothetical protein
MPNTGAPRVPTAAKEAAVIQYAGNGCPRPSLDETPEGLIAFGRFLFLGAPLKTGHFQIPTLEDIYNTFNGC